VEVASSVHEIVKFVSVRDAVIWMAGAIKHVSTQEPKASSGSIIFYEKFE
jgi:hypothetical protein